ncbi:thiamine biosynthesis protein [Capnocytophaga stomatis]|uniref:FAD:protein FMN transferase n=1 Tax=Capnocytophaga stomatis TaxID=1848904 RepID=A0A250FYC7_9FLAO|nr:FAD:protein FMN transferase [Capnocytophaga stomatis]ATA88957.1 thiamine biosynthesis protein [Capnocytophaga stomatis]
MKKILFFAILAALFSCSSKKDKTLIIKGKAQGSTYGIKYISNSDENLKPAIDSILEVIDLSMSTYRPESIISKINQGEKVKIDTHFEKVFLASQKIWQESEGLFDPTIGILVNAWGFGKNKTQKNLSQKEIDSLKNFVGFHKVRLTEEKYIEKENPAIFFDFNAIAQGYTVDVIADFLKAKNIHNFIVEVGGELFLSGKNTIENKKWTIGIEDPTLPSEKRDLITTVKFENQGLATSGNYRKIWTDSLTGEKFVHSINPKTGQAKQSNLLSATVITSSAMYADGYATMFMILGLEETKSFLENHPELNVLLVYNENNEVKTFMTKGFQELND